MITSLSVSNYALIEHLEITLPEGLIIITGETGAGKSILLGAISLLMGSKCDTGVLKNENKNCIVEAEFNTTPDSSMTLLFENEGIETDKNIVVRRVISPGGKSRSFVNDNPVSLQFLKTLSEYLIDIHAQHQHLLLADSTFQLSVLDSFCGNGPLIEDYTECYKNYNDAVARVKRLTAQLNRSSEESDYDNYVLNQLKEAQLKEGELEELEDEYALLSSAGEIRSSFEEISKLTNIEDISFVANLKEAVSILNRTSAKFKPASELAERLESCRIELRDIEAEIAKLAESVNLSPERVSILEERISLIYSLMKRHKRDSVKELIDLRDELENKNSSSDNLKFELEEAQKEADHLKRERDRSAEKLRESRESSLKRFADVVTYNIRELEMPHAQFIAELEDLPDYGAMGSEGVRFMFSANKNVQVRELNKIASGGEMSRIMLCLKTLNVNTIGTPTMIFDEIDTGVSGRIADKMGNLLVELSKNLQIFAITHLPQIASKGGTHLLVYKDIEEGGVTKTKIKEISGSEREEEIARMLSGSQVTNAAFENARELLKNGNNLN